MLTFVVQSHRGVEQLVARRAHNPEAGGSSPSPATKKKTLNFSASFSCLLLRVSFGNLAKADKGA